MTSTIPGKLTTQGPIATLAGDFDFSGEDRFMFNGDQFVHFIAQVPRAVEASANSLIYMSGDQVFFSRSWSSYENSNGDYRLVDGDTSSDGYDTGRPTSSYDHVIVGYNAAVSTDTVKFWAESYIPYELIRIDYSYDGQYFFEIPTHAGNISFEFDDSLKIYDSEDVPSGQYVYTADLGQQYIAKYWRIRSFIATRNTSKVTSVDGNDVALITTSGLPASSSLYGQNKFYYNSNTISSSLIDHETYYGTVTDNGDTTYTVSNVLFTTGGSTGTVYAGALTISVEEYVYEYSSSWECDASVSGCNSYICAYGNRSTYPACFTEVKTPYLSHVNTLYQVESYANFNITTPTEYVNVTVDGFLPTYLPGQTGPNGGVIKVIARYLLGYAARLNVDYTSIAGNTIETVDTPAALGTDLEAGQHFYYTYPMALTQVKIPERVGPQLRYWESDGSTAVTNTVVLSDIYDVAYDVADGVFYVVRFNETGGTGNPTIIDEFAVGYDSTFDSYKWETYGNGFYRDMSSTCLVFSNTASGIYVSGDLVSHAYFTSDFTTTLPVVVDTLSGTGYYGSAYRDSEYDNQVAGIYTVGEWGVEAADRALSAVAVSAVSNATDGVVSVRDLRIDPYNLPEDEFNHLFEYVTGSGWYYTRTNVTYPGVNDISYHFSSPGPSLAEDGFFIMFDNNEQTIYEGSSVSFTTERATVSGMNSDSVELYASYVNSTNVMQLSYDDTVVSDTLINRSIETFGANINANITGATSNFITVSSTSFASTGTIDWNVPSLEVYTIDEDGSVTVVSGVSSPGGVVLGNFDLLETPGGKYEDWFGKVSIATTNKTEAQGGSVLLRVGTDLYKYNKTTLPLVSRETGTNAAVLASGTLPHEFVHGLNYDGYVAGGLSFLFYDSDRSGVFLRTISDSTLLLSGYEAELDLSNDSAPFARDAEDSGVLYTVVNNNVYLFNADEDSVAFCNVVSSDPVLPASSSYSSTITARVINMFGEPLSNKRISFSITSGDGSLAPTYGCSTSSGTVSAVFTAASSVGTSVITATASNDTC